MQKLKYEIEMSINFAVRRINNIISCMGKVYAINESLSGVCERVDTGNNRDSFDYVS